MSRLAPTRFGPTRRALLASALGAGAWALVAGIARADDNGEEEDEDHERARRALEAGDVRPLSEILAELSGKLDGEIVGIEFEMEGGHYVYELKLVTADGRLVSVYVDAKTGAIIDKRSP